MTYHRRLATAAIALIVVVAAPTVEAGGSVGIHLGGSGFGVSVGFGDWGIYTSSWSDPYWSISSSAVLAGYGEWVWLDGLGRVWRPWVAASWRPYTYGRWVSTTCGWTWVSYEPWGYVPHHYGSWAYSSFGWVWVPGYSYSCANVVWVRAGGYVGWYARPPRGWSHASHGFRHGYRHGYRDGWDNGYSSGYNDGWHDARYGTFIEWRDFGAENVSRRAVPHRIASGNRIDPSVSAPTSDEVRRRGGPTMAQTRLERRTVMVDGREVTLARPDGVAESIERNAVDTVSRALSVRAIEQRQPLVKPHAEAAAASSSRATGARYEVRSPRVNGPSASRQSGASSPAESPALSSRSTRSNPSSVAGSSGTRVNTRASESTAEVQRPKIETRRSIPRGDTGARAIESRGDRNVPSAATAGRSSAAGPQRTQTSSRQLSAPQQPTSERSRQSVTTVRRVAPSPQAATTSQHRATRSSQSNSSGDDKESTDARSARRARPRKR